MNEYYITCAFPKQKGKPKKRNRVSDETYYKVFNACNGTCMLCGTKKALEMHHVLGRGKYLTDNYRYCLMLCNNCHQNIVHKNQKKYRPILLGICEELYGEQKNV